MTPGSIRRACAYPDCDRPIRADVAAETEPDDESGGADGELCPVHHGVMGDDADASAAEIDLRGVDPDTYPEDLVANGARWLLWQARDGRKIPRNPEWGRSDRDGGYAFAGAKNPDAWFEFEAVRDWVDHEAELGLAYYLTSPDLDDWDGDEKYDWVDPETEVPTEPHVGLLDFDDVRDPDTGDVAPTAAALLERLAGTFCEWSPSGTGAHALGGFTLPKGISALTIDLSTPE